MSNSKKEISRLDKKYYLAIREDVSNFTKASGLKYDKSGLHVLDIAPQDHEGAKPYFLQATVETLDLDPKSGATYIADICDNNSETIKSETFDIVVCTEVLEHTLNPFSAVDEIWRILKPDGLALVSVPFNFRIHGPLPDCWRFTEHGLRALLKNFEIEALDVLEEEDRFLMPIHYSVTARKKHVTPA